jgi:hypothetical protein
MSSTMWVWVAVAGGVGVGVWIGRRMWRNRHQRITVDAVSESWIAQQRGQGEPTD